MAITYIEGADGAWLLLGLSTDTKPVAPTADYTFLETDTGLMYDVQVGAWTFIGLFNGNSQLVQTAVDGKLPALDRSNLTGPVTASTAGTALAATNTTDAVSNQIAKFSGANATRADNDLIYNSFFLASSTGVQREFVRMNFKAPVVTNTAEDGSLIISVMSAGTLTNTLLLTKAALSPNTNDGISLGTTALMWADVFIASGGVINHNNGSTTLTGGVNLWTVGGSGANGNQLKLAPGGTSLVPLLAQSGALVSTAVAGGIEYDGLVFYGSHLASARGYLKATQYSIVSSSNFALSTAAGVQVCFEATGDVWTLNANTTYEVEGFYMITKSTNAVTTAIAFALAGGATITSMALAVNSWGGADNTISTASVACTRVVRIASTIVTTSFTGQANIFFKGFIRMNAGGTVTPQIDFSNTTTAPSMLVNSYIKFTPIGTDTNNTLGNVA